MNRYLNNLRYGGKWGSEDKKQRKKQNVNTQKINHLRLKFDNDLLTHRRKKKVKSRYH